MRSIFHTIAGFSGVNELFYDPIGWFLDEGQRHSGAIGDHDDHVHAATFDRGGVLEPGWNRVRNATGAREALAPVGELIDYDKLADAIERRRQPTEAVFMLNGREFARATAGDVATAIDEHRKKRL
jgi:hypothetical protein